MPDVSFQTISKSIADIEQQAKSAFPKGKEGKLGVNVITRLQDAFLKLQVLFVRIFQDKDLLKENEVEIYKKLDTCVINLKSKLQSEQDLIAETPVKAKDFIEANRIFRGNIKESTQKMLDIMEQARKNRGEEHKTEPVEYNKLKTELEALWKKMEENEPLDPKVP